MWFLDISKSHSWQDEKYIYSRDNDPNLYDSDFWYMLQILQFKCNVTIQVF